MSKLKNSNDTFWLIFKHCAALLHSWKDGVFYKWNELFKWHRSNGGEMGQRKKLAGPVESSVFFIGNLMQKGAIEKDRLLGIEGGVIPGCIPLSPFGQLRVTRP